MVRTGSKTLLTFFMLKVLIEGISTFHREIDPQTEQIISETTQVHELKTVYTIPFSKAKVNELSQYFSDDVQFIIKEKATGGRRYSCIKREFTELDFEELIKSKTGFTQYQNTRQKGGGMR